MEGQNEKLHVGKKLLINKERPSSSRYGVSELFYETRVLKLQRMVGEQQKITRVCTIKMSLFTVKRSWSCSHVADESRHTDGKYVMPERLNYWLALVEESSKLRWFLVGMSTCMHLL